MSRRPTVIAAAGLVTLVLGAGTTFAALGAGPSGADTKKAPPPPTAAAPAAPAPGDLAGGAVHVPDGHQALAVSLEPVPGGAGLAAAGDHVDVFAADTFKDDKGNETHAVKMVLQGIEVLKVTAGAPATPVPPTAGSSSQSSASQAVSLTAGPTVFVLAVTPPEAEKIIYHAAFQKLWFSLVPAGQAPSGPTAGVVDLTALAAS